MPDQGFGKGLIKLKHDKKFTKINQKRQQLSRKTLLPILLSGADLFALVVSFIVGHLISQIYKHHLDISHIIQFYSTRHLINLLTFLLLSAIIIRQFHIYGHYSRRLAFWDEIGSILLVLSTALAFNAAIAFAGKWQLSRLWMFSAWFAAFAFVVIFRITALATAAEIGLLYGPTAILGCGDSAAEAIKALAEERFLGCQPKWLIIPPGTVLDPTRFPASLNVLDLGNHPLQTLKNLGNPLVIAALETGQWDSMQELIRLLGLSYPNLILSPPFRRLPLCGLETMHFFGHDVLMLRPRDNLAAPGARFLKRLFDILVASILLVLLSPAFLYVSARVRRADGGRAYYSQTRIGRYGRGFNCFKFRSMITNADTVLEAYLTANPAARVEYEQNFKLLNDPRITSFGKFLRRTSLDELPQLVNILRGEMSLVGPRPVTSQELNLYYGDLANTYTRVLPGMTGLWQVSGRSETSYNQRISYDVWYVKNWTLWYDIVILLRTVKVVFSRAGAY